VSCVDPPMLFDVEGEQVGTTPATLTCLPNALRLCAPRAGKGR
jgi:diacylglycerol kinase family enzyme